MIFCCPYHVRLSVVFRNKWKPEGILAKTYSDPVVWVCRFCKVMYNYLKECKSSINSFFFPAGSKTNFLRHLLNAWKNMEIN